MIPRVSKTSCCKRNIYCKTKYYLKVDSCKVDCTELEYGPGTIHSGCPLSSGFVGRQSYSNSLASTALLQGLLFYHAVLSLCLDVQATYIYNPTLLINNYSTCKPSVAWRTLLEGLIIGW